MFKSFFLNSPLLVWPLVALMIFMGVFAVIIFRTFGRRRNAEFDAAAQLPLAEEVNHS